MLCFSIFFFFWVYLTLQLLSASGCANRNKKETFELIYFDWLKSETYTKDQRITWLKAHKMKKTQHNIARLILHLVLKGAKSEKMCFFRALLKVDIQNSLAPSYWFYTWRSSNLSVIIITYFCLISCAMETIFFRFLFSSCSATISFSPIRLLAHSLTHALSLSLLLALSIHLSMCVSHNLSLPLYLLVKLTKLLLIYFNSQWFEKSSECCGCWSWQTIRAKLIDNGLHMCVPKITACCSCLSVHRNIDFFLVSR